MEAIIGFFLIVIIAIAIVGIMVIYSSFVWGLICYKFWYWFVLPVFTTLPEVNYWQAVGLMFFIGLFRNQVHSKQKDKEENNNWWSSFIFTPWVTLLIGYMFHLFMR